MFSVWFAILGEEMRHQPEDKVPDCPKIRANGTFHDRALGRFPAKSDGKCTPTYAGAMSPPVTLVATGKPGSGCLSSAAAGSLIPCALIASTRHASEPVRSPLVHKQSEAEKSRYNLRLPPSKGKQFYLGASFGQIWNCLSGCSSAGPVSATGRVRSYHSHLMSSDVAAVVQGQTKPRRAGRVLGAVMTESAPETTMTPEG